MSQLPARVPAKSRCGDCRLNGTAFSPPAWGWPPLRPNRRLFQITGVHSTYQSRERGGTCSLSRAAKDWNPSKEKARWATSQTYLLTPAALRPVVEAVVGGGLWAGLGKTKGIVPLFQQRAGNTEALYGEENHSHSESLSFSSSPPSSLLSPQLFPQLF